MTLTTSIKSHNVSTYMYAMYNVREATKVSFARREAQYERQREARYGRRR